MFVPTRADGGGYYLSPNGNGFFQADASAKKPQAISKALAIRNPKTGEVITPEAPGTSMCPSLSARAKWRAAAPVVCNRLRRAQWRADHSTFSALHVDGLRRDASARAGGAISARVRGGGACGSEVNVLSALKLTRVFDKRFSVECQQQSSPSVAATLAALQLDPGQGKCTSADATAHQDAVVAEATSAQAVKDQTAGKRPWRHPRDEGTVTPSTSAGELTCNSHPEFSEGASGEDFSFPGEAHSGEAGEGDASSEEGVRRVESLANRDVRDEHLGDFFSPSGKRGKLKAKPTPKDAAAVAASAPEAAPRAAQAEEAREDGILSQGQLPAQAPEACEDVAVHFVAFRAAWGRGAACESYCRFEQARRDLLDFRATMDVVEAPQELRALVARDESATPAVGPASSSPSWRAPIVRTESLEEPPPVRASRVNSVAESVMTPSPSAYRAGSFCLSRKDEIKRAVQSLLNKICPENVATIGEKMADIKVETADELEEVIGLIFKKSLSEPHYCETYADLVFCLKTAFPEFPNPAGGKPLTFKGVLLNICQNEFEALPTSLQLTPTDGMDPEEAEMMRKKTKDRVLANMKLIGHLFLRQLLTAKVIGSVIQELTLCDSADRFPEEHVIECAVELLMSIGHTLESMPIGKSALGQVCGRLLDLRVQRGKDGKHKYSKRIQFAIQDMLDARAAGWARKVFGGVAKTKEEIRLEQKQALDAQAKGRSVGVGEVVVAGQRPLYIQASKSM